MLKIPPKEQLLENKWVKWIGPKLHHPEFWVWSRRNVATGVALGFFCAFMVPLAQIPIAIALGVLFRANLPVCAALTFITNPFTTPAIFFGAYEIGSYLLSVDNIPAPYLSPSEAGGWVAWALGIGKPTFLGLSLITLLVSSVSYFLVRTVWGFKTRLQWINRSKKRLAKANKV